MSPSVFTYNTNVFGNYKCKITYSGVGGGITPFVSSDAVSPALANSW